MYKISLMLLILLLNIVTLGNPNEKVTLGYFHIIRNDKIQTMKVIENEHLGDETFVEIIEDHQVADMEISGMSDQEINTLIAKRILDFEGEKLVQNDTEYSKYGITIETLENYNCTKNMNLNLENLTSNDAIDIIIYLMNKYRVTEIKDPKIRIIVFDTIYNTGYRRASLITQKTFNFYNDLYGDGKRISIDGVIGSETIEKLNNIKKVDIFIQLFIFERLDTYKKFKEWNTYKNGWTKRILTVSDIDI